MSLVSSICKCDIKFFVRTFDLCLPVQIWFVLLNASLMSACGPTLVIRVYINTFRKKF